MNTELFSKAMNEVSDRYYEEAAHYQVRRQRWVRYTSLAACVALVLAVSFASLRERLPGQMIPQPEADPPAITATAPPSDHTEPVAGIAVNEIDPPHAVVGGSVDLDGYDTAMTYEELLAYFDVALPITETLPYLTLQKNGFGVFCSKDGGIWVDGNCVIFEGEDGTQRMSIGLAKVSKHIGGHFDLTTEDELKFTHINGRELAVFHYTDENGVDSYHTEFLQDDVSFKVSAEGILVEEYVSCLQALVEQTQLNTASTGVVAGEIITIDPSANQIGIQLHDGAAPQYSRVYGIDLPDGLSAEDYSLGDSVEVTYTGEPATICTIWAQQVVDVSLLP